MLANNTPSPNADAPHLEEKSNLSLYADGSCPELTVAISAPGKVILHGEHSVVYGKLAVAASLGLRTNLILIEQKALQGIPGIIKVELKELGLIHTYDLNDVASELMQMPLPLNKPANHFNWEKPDLIDHEELLSRIKLFVDKYSGSLPLTLHQKVSLISLFYLFAGIFGSVVIPLKSFSIKIETNLTISSGSGSSASYAVAVAGAFIQYLRQKAIYMRMKNVSKSDFKPSSVWCTSLKKFDEKELEIISSWAFLAEKIIHGLPSGIDNTVCTYGSAVEFRKGVGSKPLQLCAFKLILVNTKVRRDTKRLVKNVSVLKQRHPEIVELILNGLDEIAKNAVACLKQLSQFHSTNEYDEMELKLWYDKLGELTDMNQNLLRALGVSHSQLDKICSICKEAGLYCKLTGAGGGGFAIALVPPYVDSDKVEELTEKLQSHGFETIVTDLGGPGVTVD